MAYHKLKQVKYIVLHHTATKMSENIDIKDIDKWHKDRGWMKVGYHAYIKKDGTVQFGRFPREIGAHVKGHNHESVGIALEGGVDDKGNVADNFTIAQYNALVKLLKFYQYFYPRAELVKHKDIAESPTDCNKINIDSVKKDLALSPDVDLS